MREVKGGIQLNASEAFSLLLKKETEMVDAVNSNLKLWNDIKNTVLGGMIIIVILQMAILFMLALRINL